MIPARGQANTESYAKKHFRQFFRDKKIYFRQLEKKLSPNEILQAPRPSSSSIPTRTFGSTTIYGLYTFIESILLDTNIMRICIGGFKLCTSDENLSASNFDMPSLVVKESTLEHMLQGRLPRARSKTTPSSEDETNGKRREQSKGQTSES